MISSIWTTVFINLDNTNRHRSRQTELKDILQIYNLMLYNINGCCKYEEKGKNNAPEPEWMSEDILKTKCRK